MIKKRIKKILALILFALFVVQFALTTLPISAADVGSFDNTAIEDDLKNVDLKNYPQNSLGEVDIISLMEYGYSEQSYIDKYFGIYVYVYNPTGKPITLSGNNYVELGFYENGVMKPDSVNLQYLDRTSDNLIYKFKLDQSARILASARSYAAVNEGKRCYEISGIQFTANSLHADVSKKYVWSGYAAYCGPDSSPDSTLTCLDYGLKSIHLNLMHTNYRFADKSDEAIGGSYELRDELNSVFLSIPEEYFQDFGNLNKISAQWYEYKTNLMYVTSNADAYSSLFEMRNISINEYGCLSGSTQPLTYYRVLWKPYAIATSLTSPVSYNYYAGYNPFCRATYINGEPIYSDTRVPILFGNAQTRIDWLFYIDSDIAGYDIFGEDGLFTSVDYCVTSDQVKEYMKTYTNRFNNQDKILGKYASSLFADSIDEDRLQFLVDENATSGLVKMDYYIDQDKNTGNSFFNPDNAWFKFWFGGEYEEITYSPMIIVSEGDLVLSDEEFSEKYYVNLSDVKKFKSEAEKAYKNNECPVLLRFAVTDYYSSSASFDYSEGGLVENIDDFNGYVAQETVFLDFDVLSLGFMDEENGYVETLIPVVAEPIDVINGLTPPDDLVEDEEWYQKLVALILFIIVLFVGYVLLDIYVPWLAKIIRWVLGAFWWLFKSLVKLITWPFRALLSDVGRSVKRKFKIKGRRGRPKGRRGRPSKKKPKKETRNRRLMKETFGKLKDKAYATLDNIKNKNKKE